MPPLFPAGEFFPAGKPAHWRWIDRATRRAGELAAFPPGPYLGL